MLGSIIRGQQVNTARVFLVVGALLAALGVAMGAFGAHALRASLSADRLAVYHTAVQYHLWHALGLLLIGVLIGQGAPSTLMSTSGWLMLAGIVAFSGSLYTLALTGTRWLGMVTPIGGLAFIAAWLTLVLAIVRR